MIDYTLRRAEPRDVPQIVGLITELAEFERLAHLLEVTPERLHPHLFGSDPVARCLVAELGAEPGAEPGAERAAGLAADRGAAGQEAGPGRLAGFALYFRNFSTFLSRPGLYLEDLYVQPAWRGAGIGKALLLALAAEAQAAGCGRFEWSVLDWNQNAIRFYEKMGAELLPDWRICRVTGPALQRLAATAGHSR
jgi:GNAT superfamily N-acetyltransferase